MFCYNKRNLRSTAGLVNGGNHQLLQTMLFRVPMMSTELIRRKCLIKRWIQTPNTIKVIYKPCFGFEDELYIRFCMNRNGIILFYFLTVLITREKIIN